MNAIKILAIVLIVGGILGLAYGKLSYPTESHHATVGPMEFSVTDTQTVNIPLWAGVLAVVAGGILLFVPATRLRRT